MKVWSCYLCIITLQIIIIVTVLYNVHVSQPDSGQIDDVGGEYQALSRLHICDAALNGKTVQVLPSALSTMFGIDSCPYYVLENHYITTPLSTEEAAFPLAYVMTISQDFDTFEWLFWAIYMPQNVYCIHVDKAATIDFKIAVSELLECFSNAFISSQSEYIIYGGKSRLQADLACMRDLIASTVQWRYVTNTGDHDFPLKTNREIVQYLKTMNWTNITPNLVSVLKSTERIKYTHREYRTRAHAFVLKKHKKKSPPPRQLKIHFGSSYVALTREFVHFALYNKIAIELLQRSQDTYSPDKHFWITLNNIPVEGTGPWILAVNSGSCQNRHICPRGLEFQQQYPVNSFGGNNCSIAAGTAAPREALGPFHLKAACSAHQNKWGFWNCYLHLK
nr:RecName: Full=Beta-1,3-galactosyl-O-glycosyl-glycoprotein beta-1,6-N-acetylglucosaminyltransferase 6 [Homo sapiens]